MIILLLSERYFMSIDVGKCKKLLGEVVAAAITSSKPVQKAAAGAKDAVERLPMPSSSQVLAYHTGFRGKTTAVSKKPFDLTRAIIEDRKKELLQLNDLRPKNSKISDFEIYCDATLPPEDYERIKDCLFIECRGNNQISKKELEDILRLSDEEYKMFSELVSIKGRGDNQLCVYYILNFLKEATPEQFERVKTLSYIKAR